MTAAVATCPPCKPLQPVNVLAYLVGGATVDDVRRGNAVLSITDLARGEEAPYWLQALYDGGRCTGFRVRKFGGEDAHTVTRDLTACTCPDRAFRSNRPGGCRHIAALRQALPTVARDNLPAQHGAVLGHPGRSLATGT